MSNQEVKQKANWVVKASNYEISEKGMVKILSPDGRIVCFLSKEAMEYIANNADSFANTVQDVVYSKPFNEILEKRLQTKADDKIAKFAEKAAAKALGNLDMLAKTNPEALKTLLAALASKVA